MGSGLIHCAVSNQVIREGEEIILIPILQESSRGIVKLKVGEEVVTQSVPEWLGLSDKYYTTMGFAFAGVAEDYACQRIEPSHEVWEFLNSLKKRLVPSLQGDNTYHEKSFDSSDLDWLPDKPEEFTSWPKRGPYDATWWQDFTDKVHKHRVWFRGLTANPQFIQFCVVLKSVWEDMVQGWESWKNEAMSKIQGYIDALTFESPNPHTLSRFGFVMAVQAVQFPAWKPSPLSYYSWWENMLTGQDILEALKKGALDRRYQLYAFEEKCNLYGILHMPNCGYTQDYGNEQGKAYAKLVNKASERKRPGYED